MVGKIQLELVFYSEFNPVYVAKKFCSTHGLDEKKTVRVEAALRAEAERLGVVRLHPKSKEIIRMFHSGARLRTRRKKTNAASA